MLSQDQIITTILQLISFFSFQMFPKRISSTENPKSSESIQSPISTTDHQICLHKENYFWLFLRNTDQELPIKTQYRLLRHQKEKF